MPNGVFNWKFNDVVDFLKENGFHMNYSNGSHFYYAGNYGGQLRQVCVPFHGNLSFKPRTFKGMIRQSGIPLNSWLGR